MEILFYHLTESRVEDALPSLLERSLERNWRVAVQTVDDARCELLDDHLWTFRPDSFLPHGMDSGPNADLQPILLTSGAANQNKAGVRFVIDGAEPPELHELTQHHTSAQARQEYRSRQAAQRA